MDITNPQSKRKMSDYSLVFWSSDLEKHYCGYCKNKKGNISHGMWAKTLTPSDYQNLIDRGWRRSGNYCYKPVMDQICCPMYTIKCEALNFQLSKSHKKIIKKFNKFLKDGELTKSNGQLNPDDSSDNISDFVYRDAPKHLVNQQQSLEVDILENDEVDGSVASGSHSSQNLPEQGSSKSLLDAQSSQMSDQRKPQPKSGVGADPNRPPCKKAKLLRMERRQEKCLKRGMSLEKLAVRNEQKTLEDFLNEIPENGKHKFKLEIVRTVPYSEDWERLTKIEFALYRKYQMAIHNDPPEKCRMEGFLRFLVNSPVQYVKFSKNSDLGFGSFHQLYWLDDKLIAVGVIDILPKCVSAVYFFYDPDYRDLSLGTYGSLREVEFARHLHQNIPSIENYYMGFYIHSCPKMRYKGKLVPSYLLCPETYRWVAIEKCLGKLDVSKYSKLEEDETATDENNCSASDVDEIKLLLRRRIVPFKQYGNRREEEDSFNTIARLVGRKCLNSILFFTDP